MSIKGPDVEDAIRSCATVTEVVVMGTPHAHLGEIVEVVVVAPFTLEIDELRSHTATLVSASHLPRRWHRWDSLPLTASGKIDRPEVRRRLTASRSQEAMT